MKIKIWDPNSCDEADAEEQEIDESSLDLGYEVEVFAEKTYDEAWHGEREFHVRIGEELKVFGVGIEWDPSFSAREIKEQP